MSRSKRCLLFMRSQFLLLTIIGLTLFRGIENNPYANYGVEISVQKLSYYDGPINMGINTVSNKK